MKPIKDFSALHSRHLSDLPDALTTKECMSFLNIGRNSLYKLLKEGSLGSIRVGKKYIIPKSSLEHYLSVWYNSLMKYHIQDSQKRTAYTKDKLS